MFSNIKINPKLYKYLKIIICLNPLIFAFFVIYNDFVDYRGATESSKYTSIAYEWLGYSSTNSIDEFKRLPVYSAIISLIFKVFGVGNLYALLIFQSILGVITFFYLIKSLEILNLDKNIIILLTFLFNLNIVYRFSVFLPNCIFIFFISLFIYNFTIFYFQKNKISFYFMCIFIFLLLLTRPTLQLIIFITFPILIFFLSKQNFSKKIKLQFITILILSYVLGIGTQFYRSYSKFNQFVYTTQAGQHLSLWVIPCLSKKYGCDARDKEVLDYIQSKYQKEILNKNFSEIEKDRVLKKIGIDYFINEVDKKKALVSIFFSYAKLLLHTSLTEVYDQFQVEFKSFSTFEGISFFQKLNELIKKTFSDPKYFFWCLCLFFLFIMRFVQIVAIFTVLNNKKMTLYILIILSLIPVILMPAIGMSNPRYRSEIEPILLILGAIGIDKINYFYKNYFLKSHLTK
jgi:hypothetical protein